jgi:hypothetical protein
MPTDALSNKKGLSRGTRSSGGLTYIPETPVLHIVLTSQAGIIKALRQNVVSESLDGAGGRRRSILAPMIVRTLQVA